MTIGVDLKGTNIRAGIRSGDTISGFRQEVLRDKESLDSTLQQLKDFIRPLVSKATESIGVAVPSIVDAEQGVVYEDRKSTRLNSSHVKISYAVFCLKKKHRD